MSRSPEILLCLAATTLLVGCTPDATTTAAAGTAGIEEAGVPGGPITPDPAMAGHFAYGKTATPEEIAGWDIDIRPDGAGLPEGSGSVEDGEMLYEEYCASCHGSFGEAVGRYPVLAGGFDTLTEERPEKTVGSYWPYASTLWDYIHRAMPFAAPQSLEDDEVYAITAYVLHLNDIVDYEFVLTRESLATIEMPNAGNFYRDDRPDVAAERCMKNCKDPASIRITSEPQVGVTPSGGLEDDGATGQQNAASASAGSEAAPDNGQGSRVYSQACGLCHDAGVAGAPVTGDAKAWAQRLEKGLDTLNNHAINGFTGDAGVMPAKGGQMQLSDEEVRAAVLHMVEASGG